MSAKKYSNYLEINPTFESVVDIDADRRHKNLWREYIVGDDMENLLEYMCQSLGNEMPDARRSFWINGSYGTGKSYAGIFVKHLMEEKPAVVEDFLSKNSRLSAFKNRFAKCRMNGDYLVVWKTGCTGIRSGDMMLIEVEKAIRDALIVKFGEGAKLGSGSLLDAIREKLDDPTINWDVMLKNTRLGDDYASVKSLRSSVDSGDLGAIQAVAATLRQKNIGLVNNLDTFKKWISEVIDDNGLNKSGIFFIWDEFTEYVSYADDHTVLQQISEFCKVTPFFTFFIVHKSADLVARVGGDEHYQLIIDRFHNVEFHLTADASLDLIANSINTRNGMEENWKDARKQVINNIRPSLVDMVSGLEDKMVDMIDALCPIHPMTIRLLSRVAENYAAAERTMFRFMKDQSNEDIGFVGYINKFGPDDQICWLTPEWLWDYFFTRDSDFHDKDTKVAEYIHHYEENRSLVEQYEDAHRLFKIVMLLLAVMSSAKGIYSRRHASGGISATVECLVLCLAGVMDESRVRDLLSTLQDNKLIVLDTVSNEIVRLQLPFRNDGGSFQLRYEKNDKSYTRYQMFSKDGVFAKEFEKQAWNSDDAVYRRMKICVCCAETTSIKTRLEEINKELEKNPFKLGLLIVIVKDDPQFVGIQKSLQQLVADADNGRLTIALVKNPFPEEKRKKWLNAITKRDLADESGQTGVAGQARRDAEVIVNTWVQSTVSSSKILAWNGTQAFSNQYGMPQLRQTIRKSIFEKLFPYAPENIVVTSTAYKPCTDGAPLAGIQRRTANAQLKSVLSALGELQKVTDIKDIAKAKGNNVAEAVAQLAKVICDNIVSGQKVVLSDLWTRLMEPPFGYYDTIACGVLLGYVFTGLKGSAYSWTDSSKGGHILDEATLKTMVYNMVKGKMTTDYLSSGSQTFQLFREYVKAIMGLSDTQVANETECWHNMRESVTKSGAPFWTLKYLPEGVYHNEELKNVSLKIIDQIQQFIAQDHDRETIMDDVNQLFSGHGKVRVVLSKNFQDKHVLNNAFRSFLFDVSPELQKIADKLTIKPEELNDKLQMVMQGAVYTWTEDQVKEKLPAVVSEYRYLDSLNLATGTVFHSLDDAKKELGNLFSFVRIPVVVLETLKKPWLAALKTMYKVSNGSTEDMTVERRAEEATELSTYGKQAMDFLKDGKPVLYEYLESNNQEYQEYQNDELEAIYSGLQEMTFDTSASQFEKELKIQIGHIRQARNRVLLKTQWGIVSGVETVKEWCTKHSAPLLWIVPKESRKALETVVNVLENRRTLDQDVCNALTLLKQMDAKLFSDDQRIIDSLVDIVGQEYKDIFEAEHDQLIIDAKLQLGNDMSAWDINKLQVFQNILKKAKQEKAKREKLNHTKNQVREMNENQLRKVVLTFLESHPEFCDNFNA